MPVSPETLLRRVRQHHFPDHPIPRVVGVDNWAFYKGHRYRILWVDLEHHRPIDLLPDRAPSTLASWLKGHPGIDIIIGDRSPKYAEAAREGMPLHVARIVRVALAPGPCGGCCLRQNILT